MLDLNASAGSTQLSLSERFRMLFGVNPFLKEEEQFHERQAKLTTANNHQALARLRHVDAEIRGDRELGQRGGNPVTGRLAASNQAHMVGADEPNGGQVSRAGTGKIAA